MNYTLLRLAVLASLLPLAACGSLSEEERWLQQNTLNNLVFVDGGTFTMGDVGYTDANGKHQSFSNDGDNTVLHKVTLSPYSVLKYEVTFKELDIYTSAIGETLINKKRRSYPEMQPEYPAQGMTWEQAQGYCQWVGKRLLGYPMDLLTEAQWEYAATSRGKAVAYATNNGLYERGVNVKHSGKNEFEMPVGSWPPNPLGLYDMTGNVGEWVTDWYMSSYLREDEADMFNPTGPTADHVKEYYLKDKVTRGGGALGTKHFILYRRIPLEPEITGAGNGIRCAVNNPQPITAPAK
jgi:formylglycine-generating enzyme required for sulfatase activity